MLSSSSDTYSPRLVPLSTVSICQPDSAVRQIETVIMQTRAKNSNVGCRLKYILLILTGIYVNKKAWVPAAEIQTARQSGLMELLREP